VFKFNYLIFAVVYRWSRLGEALVESPKDDTLQSLVSHYDELSADEIAAKSEEERVRMSALAIKVCVKMHNKPAT
jgi:hypothetical protein